MGYRKEELEEMLSEASHVYDCWQQVKKYMYEAGWRVFMVDTTFEINGVSVPVKSTEPSRKIWEQYDKILIDRIEWVTNKLENAEYEIME